MSNAKTIAVLGHSDHGKTTLVSAITAVISIQKNDSKLFVDYEALMEGGSTTCTTKSGAGITLVDYPSDADSGLFEGKVDSVILVVSGPDGPMPGTREQLQTAADKGVSQGVVFISKTDQVDDDEVLELITTEIQELWEEVMGGELDDGNIVAGSALNTVESDSTDPNDADYEAVAELIGKL